MISCDLILQILLYPRIAKLLGYRRSFRAGLVVFTIGCILLPLANQISGPIGSGHISQSNVFNNSNSSIYNTTAANITNDNYDDIVEYSGIEDDLLDNNITNDTCHSSRLDSVGGDSIGHIPLRVWLTVCWILTMIVIGR